MHKLRYRGNYMDFTSYRYASITGVRPSLPETPCSTLTLHHFSWQAFLPGSKKILSMSSEKLLLWNTPTPNSEHDVIEFRRSRISDFVCMKLSSNGRMLAASTVDNIVTIWDVATVQVILAQPGHSS